MITPADTPSSPENYAGVATQGMNIQADQQDLSGLAASAEALTGAGVLYAQGPRQAATERLMASPPGFGEFNITAGFSGGGGDGWPNLVAPSA